MGKRKRDADDRVGANRDRHVHGPFGAAQGCPMPMTPLEPYTSMLAAVG